MRNIIIIFSLLLFSTSVFSQSKAPKWIEANYRNFNYSNKKYYKVFKDAEYNRRSLKKDLKELTIESKQEISSMILSHLSYSSASSMNEDTNGIYTNYSENTVLESDIDIVAMQTKQYVDKKKDKIFVFSFVLKSELGNFYSKKLEFLLSELNEESNTLNNLINNFDSSTNENSSKLNIIKRIKKVKEDIIKADSYRIILASCDFETPSYVNSKFAEIKKRYNNFEVFSNHPEFLTKLNRAKQLHLDRNYIEALKFIKEAIFLNPDSDEANSLLKKYNDLISIDLVMEAERNLRLGDYKLALKNINEALKFNATNGIALQSKIKTNYFEHLYNMLSNLIKNDNLYEVEKYIDDFNNLHDIDNRKFQKLTDKYLKLQQKVDERKKELQFLKHLSDLKINIDDNDFYPAKDKLREASKFNPNSSKLTLLKEKAIEKRYKYYKKQELEKEFKKFQLRFGVGKNVIYDNTEDVKFDKVPFNDGKLYYSISLFRRSKKPNNSIKLTGFTYNYGKIQATNYYQNLEFGFVFSEVLKLSTGILTENTLNFGKPEFSSTTIGLNIPISFLNLSANYVQLYKLNNTTLFSNDNEFQSMITIDVSIKLDFFRKVKKQKKDELMLESKLFFNN